MNYNEFLLKVRDLFKEHEKAVTEKILFDVLSILYYQDYNRECDYKKMTGEEIVKAQHIVIKQIEERYNYHLSDELF